MADQKSVAEQLHEEYNVPDLRELCREHNVSRERGATKAETARAIAEQAPEAAADAVGAEVEDFGHVVICTCGLEEEYDDAANAVEAAKDHLSGCKEGLGVDGLGGLSVWDEDVGCRTWAAGEGDIVPFENGSRSQSGASS